MSNRRIAWWEWAAHANSRQKEAEESHKKSREYLEKTIRWELPNESLPVTSKEIRWGRRETHMVWYVANKQDPQSFIYLLKEIGTEEIFYVGITDDPPRRFMEHRRKNKLGKEFTMIIVAVGDTETELAWISRCLNEGHKLQNHIGLTKK